jgi:hypothetical protein
MTLRVIKGGADTPLSQYFDEALAWFSQPEDLDHASNTPIGRIVPKGESETGNTSGENVRIYRRHHNKKSPVKNNPVIEAIRKYDIGRRDELVEIIAKLREECGIIVKIRNSAEEPMENEKDERPLIARIFTEQDAIVAQIIVVLNQTEPAPKGPNQSPPEPPLSS